MTIPVSKKTGTSDNWLLIIKLVVTTSLVALLVSKADWPNIFKQATQIGPLLILIAFAILVLSVSFSAYKWQLFLKIHGLEYGFNALHRYYFIAMYINNFLPTSIGGDGYRIYKTLDNKRSRSSAVIAILMERVTGLSALLVLAYISAAYLFVARNDEVSLIFLLAGAAAAVVSLAAFVVFPAKQARRLLSKFPRLVNLSRSLLSHLDDYLTRPHLTFKLIAVSFIFHIHLSLAYLILLNAGLNLSVSIFEIFVVLALVGIIGVLPISINGIGVVEGSFIFLTAQYGVGYDDALMVSLLIRILVVPISIIGAALFLFEDNRLSDIKKVKLPTLSKAPKPTDPE